MDLINILAIPFGLFAIYILWSVIFSCNHDWQIIEWDDKYDCHLMRCKSCGETKTNDPYAGIGG